MKSMSDFIGAVFTGMKQGLFYPKQDNHGNKYIIVNVDVDDWINNDVFPDCPVQNKARAERQGKKAHLNGVGGMNLEQVACAIITKHTEDGDEYREVCKLDGHSRALAWKEGKLNKPAFTLDCKVYFLDDDSEKLSLLFHAFDSKAACENTSDIVFGNMNMMQFEGKSELCKNTYWTSAWKYLLLEEGEKNKDIKNEILYKLLEKHGYDHVMHIIDGLDCKLQKVNYPTGLRMAMMWTIKTDNSENMKKSLRVWSNYRDAMEGKIAEDSLTKRIHCAALKAGYGGKAQRELFHEIINMFEC